MKAFHFFLMMVCLSITHLTAQSIVWDKTYGGDSGDGASSIVSTPDGGYLLGGTSNSGIGYEKSQPYKHLSDYWVIKVDAQGNEQ